MLIKNRKRNIYENIEAIEEQIKLELPQLNLKNLPRKFGRVSHYLRGSIKYIDEEERLIYDFILRHKLNHRTLHNWFLLRDAPYELKQRIINKRIWLRHALKERAMYRRLKEHPNDNTILNDIRKIIRGVFDG